MNIPFFEMAGFEADDLLGSIADQGQSAKDKAQSIDEVVIVTGDRDILQLVDDKRKVRVYLPVRGLSDAKLMKSDDVVEKLGVKPVQIPDYKALVGDPSDNYPGVAGIGPKTAIDLLTRFGTLQGIYEHLNEINESALKKLEDGKESAYLSLKLAQIVTNVELDSDLEKTKRWQVDSPQLIALFSSYGFKTLTQRVKDVGKSVVDENQGNLFQ